MSRGFSLHGAGGSVFSGTTYEREDEEHRGCEREEAGESRLPYGELRAEAARDVLDGAECPCRRDLRVEGREARCPLRRGRIPKVLAHLGQNTQADDPRK